MILERHERTELVALLALLKQQTEAAIESCIVPGESEPREAYRDIVRHDRDIIDVIDQWTVRLYGSEEPRG